jgi:7-cyano-7-deazaguanine synthase
MSENKKAIILSSGGLDSTTVMAIAKAQGFDLYSLSFFYGQRHRFELIAAEKVAKTLGVIRHLVLNVDLGPIGGSALTDDIEVPKGRDESQMAAEIPVTYVPARNTIFLSYALAWAEVAKAADIFIGVNAVDYSGYPDCRPEFIQAFERMANLATKASACDNVKLRIQTPLLNLSKAEIIQKGISLGVDYSLTHSCYDPTIEGLACGECDSCLLRKKGFADANISDPTRYTL